MGNNRHNPPPSKPPQPDIRELTQRLEALEKLVRDTLDEKNLWNAKVREWIGKRVTVSTMVGSLEGSLLWVDRYTVCIAEKDAKYETVIHKGAIVTIQRMPD